MMRLFEQSNWANLEFIRACARLSDTQLDDPLPGTAKRSIREILWHTVRSQHGYLTQLQGVDHESTWVEPATFEALLASAAESGDGLTAIATGENGAALETVFFLDGYRIEPWVVLTQALNHATEHRVEIKAKLLALGVKPPRCDGWEYGRVTGGLRELAEQREGGSVADSVADRSDDRRVVIDAAPAEVYAAICDRERIARWWGPNGFTSTIHEFDFRPGGAWRLTLHGPDGTDYPNESRFTRLVPNQSFEIEHLSGHHFTLCIELRPRGGGTQVDWVQTFDTVEEYAPIAEFLAGASRQNLERLAAEVRRGKKD
ncbi:MAG: DinB family protein [Candidatus Eisenbacteria bacterium]